MQQESVSNKPFRKLFADEHNELFRYLVKDPLLLTIFILCSIRARWNTEPSPEGLAQQEFWLSQTEYEKFGLKKSQHGQIDRKLQILIKLRLITKTGRRIGNDGASVYRFLPNKIIDINTNPVNEIKREGVTNSKGTGINNNEKIYKNDKDYKDKSQIKKEIGQSQTSKKKTNFISFLLAKETEHHV